MSLRKADANIHDELICAYRDKTLDKLNRISPKRACGLHADKLLDTTLLPEENLITVLTLRNLWLQLNFYDVDCSRLFTGGRLNDSRIARLLNRWENKLYVDPPSINLSISTPGKVVFCDGRHRAKTSHFLVKFF